MLKAVEMPKTSPADVAAAMLDGVEADDEDIFPDAMSKQLYAQWTSDHKGHRTAVRRRQRLPRL